MSVKFFSLPNLATSEVTVLEEPWNVVVDPKVLALPTAEYKARWRSPQTRHWLLMMAEGQNPGYCVSVGNQAAVLHGFMADYDGILTDDLVESFTKKPLSAYSPMWWCRSQSGKLHLFWAFERPFAVMGNAHANEVLKLVARRVKVVKWGVGYDPNSEKVTQVLDIGREWNVVPKGRPIPTEEIVMMDAALFTKSIREFSKEELAEIPMEKVAEEVHRRSWPHPVPPDFRIGTRCLRFWDAGADNPGGAQVMRDGIRVYTPHDGGFKSWRSLLGDEFCEEFVSKSMAPFYEDTTYVHSRDEYWRFFRHDVNPHYERRTEKLLRRDISRETGRSSHARRGEDLSEVEQDLYTITRRNSVGAVAPILYRPSGRITLPGIGSILNTSLVTVRAPAPRFAEVTAEDVQNAPKGTPQFYRDNPADCKWDNPFAVAGFPHIHRLLTAMFTERHATYAAWAQRGYPLQNENGETFKPLKSPQLTYLLSWLSHFYTKSARLSSNPGRGQALILAGAPGIGKSFFGRQILGGLMGGVKDAEAFYLRGSRFNADIVSSPVHLIDDKLGSRSHSARLAFTETMKITVANAVLRYEAKFGNALETVPWPGRIVVLANDDAQSMSVMPDLDMSTRDKFMMLHLGRAMFEWGTDAENQQWLQEELPYFARFLLGWRIPLSISDDRFGVRAYQDPMMAQASAENGLTQILLEVLETCIEKSPKPDPTESTDAEGWVIEGNSVKITSWIRGIDPSLAREVVDSRTVHQNLMILWKSGNYAIAYDSTRNCWRIPYRLRMEAEKTSNTPLTPSTEV